MGKAVKEEKEQKAEEHKEWIEQLHSTTDFGITQAAISLYRLAELNDGSKVLLLGEEGLLGTLLDLMNNECLSVRRVACMVVASLSACDNHFERASKRYEGLLAFLLHYVQCQVDDILTENTLLAISNLTRKRLASREALQRGFLLPLLTLTCHHDPDVIKHSLHILVLISRNYEAKKSMVCLDVWTRLQHHLNSPFFTVKKLMFAFLQSCLHHHMMRVQLAKGDLLNKMVAFVQENTNAAVKQIDVDLKSEEMEDGRLVPHALYVIHKLLLVPGTAETFLDLKGFEMLLELIEERKNEKGEIEESDGRRDVEKKVEKKMTKAASRASSKAKRNKEEAVEEKKEEGGDGWVDALLSGTHAVSSVADCLAVLCASGQHFCKLQAADLEEKVLNFINPTLPSSLVLPLIPSHLFHTSLINLLAVLAINPSSNTLIINHDTFPLLLTKHIDSPPFLSQAISLLLANLAHENQEACNFLTKDGILSNIFPLLKCPHETTLLTTTHLITTLASHPFSREALHRTPTLSLIVDVLKSQCCESRKELQSNSNRINNNDIRNKSNNSDINNETNNNINKLNSKDSNINNNNSNNNNCNSINPINNSNNNINNPINNINNPINNSNNNINNSNNNINNPINNSNNPINNSNNNNDTNRVEEGIPSGEETLLEEQAGALQDCHASLFQTAFRDSDVLIRGCLVALSALCVDWEARRQLFETGELGLLVRLLGSSCVEVQIEASFLLHHLAHDSERAWEICKRGGLKTAFHVDRQTHKRNQTNTLLLNLLFKHHLVAKLAYQGYLSDDDEIEDGFFDVGRMRREEWVELDEVGNFRFTESSIQNPVYLINPAPLRHSEQRPVEDEETARQSNNNSLIKTKSKNEMKTSASFEKQNKKKNKIENKENYKEANKEETNKAAPKRLTDLCGAFEMPLDTALCSFIEECKTVVLALPTSKHQIVLLAKMVSTRMGGQVFKENLYDFEWGEQLEDLMKNGGRVVPLGEVQWGIHHHRALLFKTVADRLQLPSSLITCAYSRSFILTSLLEPTQFLDEKCGNREQLVAVRYLVDLIFQPGELIPHPSKKAREYYAY